VGLSGFAVLDCVPSYVDLPDKLLLSAISHADTRAIRNVRRGTFCLSLIYDRKFKKEEEEKSSRYLSFS